MIKTCHIKTKLCKLYIIKKSYLLANYDFPFGIILNDSAYIK